MEKLKVKDEATSSYCNKQKRKSCIKKLKSNMSLYENINRRKRLGISRSKKKSTITDKAYANMQAGFPKKNKLKIKRQSTYMTPEIKTN